MPRKVGSESLCQYWLMLAVCRATSAEVGRCMCTTIVRSELVNGCGAIDYTEKSGAGNEVPTLGGAVSLLLRWATVIRGLRLFGRWRPAPGFLCARELPPLRGIASRRQGEACHWP